MKASIQLCRLYHFPPTFSNPLLCRRRRYCNSRQGEQVYSCLSRILRRQADLSESCDIIGKVGSWSFGKGHTKDLHQECFNLHRHLGNVWKYKLWTSCRFNMFSALRWLEIRKLKQGALFIKCKARFWSSQRRNHLESLPTTVVLSLCTSGNDFSSYVYIAYCQILQCIEP